MIVDESAIPVASDGPDVRHGGGSSSDTSSDATDEEEFEDADDFVDEENVESDSEEEDDEVDEVDAVAGIPQGGAVVLRSHRRRVAASAPQSATQMPPSDQALVQFLETLHTVPHESIPMAMPPPSMMRGPPLKPFQLQGLYWMLQREGHVAPPSPPVNRSVPLNQPWSVDDLLSCPEPFPAAATHQRHQYLSGGILSDYMGLGKTRMLIALCEATRVPQDAGLQYTRVCSSASIIICPMSLMSQWAREIASSVQPPPRVLKYYGTHRNKSIFEIAKYDYILTSYQTLAREPPDGAQPPSKLRMISWRRVILDEAHYIRNASSNQSKAATTTIEGRYRWAVTATPLQNRLADLFPLMK